MSHSHASQSESETGVDARAGDSDAVVVTDGLSKHYGALQALESLTLRIARGSIFGLLGPNGAGKTTALGILCGYIRPTAGVASVLGTQCEHLWRLRGRVAALPQDAELHGAVRVLTQLVHYGALMGLSRDAAHAKARACLDAVGLPDVAARTPAELSHGMRRRVALAQALLGEPDILLLDEPTAGHDPGSARRVKDVIRAIAPRRTVILSTNNLSDVHELCTHAAIIHRGRLSACGSVAQLTQAAAQVTIEIADYSAAPMAALRAAFGEGAVTLEEPRAIRIAYASSFREPHEAIAKALAILLEHRTPILGVRRGTSMEDAFAAATGDARK